MNSVCSFCIALPYNAASGPFKVLSEGGKVLAAHSFSALQWGRRGGVNGQECSRGSSRLSKSESGGGTVTFKTHPFAAEASQTVPSAVSQACGDIL